MPKPPSWHVLEYCRRRSCTKRTQQRFKKQNPDEWADFCKSNIQPSEWTYKTQLWGKRTRCAWPRKLKAGGYSCFLDQENEDKSFFKSLCKQYKKEVADSRQRGNQGAGFKVSSCGFLFRETIIECSWMGIGALKRQNKKSPRIFFYEKSQAWLDTPLHLCCWHMRRRQRKQNNRMLYKAIRRQVDNASKRERWRNDADYRKLVVDRRRLHRQKNKEQARAYASEYRKKRRQDPGIRLKQNARSRFHKVMKKVKAVQLTDSFNVFIGCSSSFLRQHIERQFEPWMTWDNYGITWQVDHKKPLNHFDLFDPVQARQAFHFSNLKPVSKEYNASKQDRWVDA